MRGPLRVHCAPKLGAEEREANGVRSVWRVPLPFGARISATLPSTDAETTRYR